MSSSDEIIGHANPHTIKKFELIEKYVETWAHKLLQNQYCSGLVFIDCFAILCKNTAYSFYHV